MVVSILFFKLWMVFCFVLFCSVLWLGRCMNGVSLCLPDKYMVFNLLLVKTLDCLLWNYLGRKISFLLIWATAFWNLIVTLRWGTGLGREAGREHEIERLREEFRVPWGISTSWQFEKADSMRTPGNQEGLGSCVWQMCLPVHQPA